MRTFWHAQLIDRYPGILERGVFKNGQEGKKQVIEKFAHGENWPDDDSCYAHAGTSLSPPSRPQKRRTSEMFPDKFCRFDQG